MRSRTLGLISNIPRILLNTHASYACVAYSRIGDYLQDLLIGL